MDKYYEDIFNRLKNGLAIFGAGVDGGNFLELQRDNLKIDFFMDNGVPRGEVRMLDGIPVYNAADRLEDELSKYVIIASSKYSADMKIQMEAAGLREERDFYVWKGCDNNINLKNVLDFISYNREIWGAVNQERREGKLLVSMMDVHSGTSIFESYYANLLAEKYDTEIVGCTCKYSSKPVFLQKTVFASFNAHDFALMDLSKKQEAQVEELYDKIYPTLHTKHDWQGLTLDGINFGFDIYSIYIRSTQGYFDSVRYERFLKNLLRESLRRIVYYDDYFMQHKVKAVLMQVGIYFEGILRQIAWKYGAVPYACSYGHLHRYPVGRDGYCYRYGRNLKKIFDLLPQQEQKKGLAWAKNQLKERLRGNVSEIPYMEGRTAYAEEIRNERIMPDDGKLKVVICPHSNSDDPYPYGRFLFPDHEDWLLFLGAMSERTNYDWYIKYHPAADRQSTDLWDQIITKFPRIKKLPIHCSPIQLRNEGMEFALTLWGTIGHEYPMLGVQVINASPNPHDDFAFCWNAKTREEYERWLLHLEYLHKDIKEEEIYQFYYVNYKKDPFLHKLDDDIFFPEKKLYGGTEYPQFISRYGSLVGNPEMYVDWSYYWFLKEEHGDLSDQCMKFIKAVDHACEVCTGQK